MKKRQEYLVSDFHKKQQERAKKRQKKDQERAKKRKKCSGGAALPPIPMEEIAACAGHAEGDALLQLDEGYEASVHAQESAGKTEEI